MLPVVFYYLCLQIAALAVQHKMRDIAQGKGQTETGYICELGILLVCTWYSYSYSVQCTICGQCTGIIYLLKGPRRLSFTQKCVPAGNVNMVQAVVFGAILFTLSAYILLFVKHFIEKIAHFYSNVELRLISKRDFCYFLLCFHGYFSTFAAVAKTGTISPFPILVP